MDWWALSHDDHLKRAFDIANELGEPKETKDELIAFLKSVPAEKLGKLATMSAVNDVLFEIPLAPIIERRLKSFKTNIFQAFRQIRKIVMFSSIFI